MTFLRIPNVLFFILAVTMSVGAQVTIGLEDVTITRDEGSSAEVCVTVIDVPLFFESGYNFNVSITTDEPGQIGPYIHELNQDVNITCQDIIIGDDYTVNFTLREIMVNLTSLTPSVAAVDEDLANGIITVLDNDEVDVSLEHQTYTFNETQGVITVCAAVVGNKTSCPIDEPEFISIATRSFTAESPEDYAAKSLMAPIPRCQRKLCADIIVEHDFVVEEMEVFQVTLEMSPGLDPRIHLRNFVHRADVQLIDNDSADVRLDNNEYVISEDSTTLSLCIETLTGSTRCSVQYNFNVSIITPFSVNKIMIPECENKTCVDIALDSFNIRTFTINLMESEELEAKRIRIDTSSSKVIVTNNDSECPELVVPEEGIIVIEDTIATYTCNDGFYVSGNEFRTCDLDTGVWSGSDPVCQRFCPLLPPLANGRVSSGQNSEEGDVARYSCDSGFELIGNAIRTCQANGAWSDMAPICQRIVMCPPLTTPTNETELSDPVCQRFCPLLPPLANGRVSSGQNSEEGDVARYTCDSGFELIGNAIRTCQANGTWSDMPPFCQRIVMCPPLPNPTNGAVLYGQDVGNLANYSCVSGFHLNGMAVRVCLADGTWSGNAPTCQPLDPEEVYKYEATELEGCDPERNAEYRMIIAAETKALISEYISNYDNESS